MAYCESCTDLANYAPNFVLNGITDTECNSLQKNTGLNPKLSVLHKNCEDLNDINDCLIGGLGDELPAYDVCDLKEYLNKLTTNLREMYKAIICGDCGQWTEIEKLWVEIEKIYELISAMSGGTYRWLTPGVDYDVKFYNGFYTESGTVRVGVIETFDRYFVRLGGTTGTKTILLHDHLVDVKMRHANPIEDVPESMMYAINFKGKYAALNNYSYTGGDNNAAGIWNIRHPGPNGHDIRASWQASLGISNNINNYKLTVSFTSYADGYNTQLDVYGNDIFSTHINHVVDLTMFK